MPTPIAVLGFGQQTEAGLATGANLAKYVDTTNGTAGTQYKIVADSAFGSGYCLEIAGAAAAAYAGFFNSGNNGILGSSGTLVGSFKFKFVSLPAADFIIFMCIGTAGGNDAFIKYLSSNSRLQGILGASTQNGPIISAGTVYQVDFRVILNSGSQTLEWSIDGVAQTTVTLSATTQNMFKAGFGMDNTTQNGTVRVSDVVWSLTSADYPLGSHKVVLLKPDTGATATEIVTANATGRMVTNSAIDSTFNSANILAATSEVPPLLGSTATGLGQRTLSATSACNLPMTTYALQSGESITGVRAVVCAWAANATAAANTLGVRSFNGATETTLFSAAAYQGQNTSVPAWICKMCTVADFDTQSELDAMAMRIGYSTDITPLPGVHAVYAEVAIKEAAGGGPTPFAAWGIPA